MILLYLLIHMMPFVEHPIFDRFAGGVTMIKYVGVGCLFYALFQLSVRRTSLRLFETRQALWFIFLALMGMVSFLTMGPPMPWQSSPFTILLSAIFLFFIVMVMVDSLDRLRGVLLVTIGSMAFASLYLIREWQQSPYADNRPGLVTGDPNYFSVSAVLCLPLAFHLIQAQRPKWEKAFCVGSLFLMLFAATLAASRGGFLGLAAGSLLIVWRSHRRIQNLVLITAVLLLFSLLTLASPLSRLLSPSHSDQQAAEGRMIVWKAGLKMIRENPLTGVGLGNFKRLVPTYNDSGVDVQTLAHNSYIDMAAELGLPGLLAFLAILFESFRTLEQVRRRTLHSGPPLLYHTTLGIEAGLVGYMVSTFFISAWWQKLFFLNIFLAMCLPQIERHAARLHRHSALSVH